MAINFASLNTIMVVGVLAAYVVGVLTQSSGGIGFGMLVIVAYGLLVGKVVGTMLLPLNFWLTRLLIEKTSLQSMAPASDRRIWFILSTVIPLALQWGVIGMLLQAMYG